MNISGEHRALIPRNTHSVRTCGLSGENGQCGAQPFAGSGQSSWVKNPQVIVAHLLRSPSSAFSSKCLLVEY